MLLVLIFYYSKLYIWVLKFVLLILNRNSLINKHHIKDKIKLTFSNNKLRIKKHLIKRGITPQGRTEEITECRVCQTVNHKGTI